MHLFPAKMIPVMLEAGAIDPEKKVNEITREERMGFVHLIKAFPLTLCGLRDFNEAIITRGGVSVKEVNPSTMESKLVPLVFLRGTVGSGCDDRRIQSADCLVDRASGGSEYPLIN